MRDESDPSYKPDVLEINDEIEALISQVKMVIGTNKGEVLGEPEFGFDLEGMLFTTDFFMLPFNTMITTQVKEYCEIAQAYPVSVDAYEYPVDAFRSAVILDIKIDEKSAFGFLLGD